MKKVFVINEFLRNMKILKVGNREFGEGVSEGWGAASPSLALADYKAGEQKKSSAKFEYSLSICFWK